MTSKAIFNRLQPAPRQAPEDSLYRAILTGESADTCGEWEGERVIQTTCADINKRKQAEQELWDASVRATAAAEAKLDFLSNISHEVRTACSACWSS